MAARASAVLLALLDRLDQLAPLALMVSVALLVWALPRAQCSW
jgi:hypothetical protein